MGLLILSTLNLLAQDVIFKKDGSYIDVRVLHVSNNAILYKPFHSTNDAILSISPTEIEGIQFENGNSYVPSSNSDISASNREMPFPIPSYRSLRGKYALEMYSQYSSDKYNPGLCGLASAILPGLGQGLAQEWGRWLGFFLGSTSLGIICYASNNETVVIFSAIGLAVLDIYSIVDAVHIAKVKNLYIKNKLSENANLTITPTLMLGNYEAEQSPLLGLSMRLSF